MKIGVDIGEGKDCTAIQHINTLYKEGDKVYYIDRLSFPNPEIYKATIKEILYDKPKPLYLLNVEGIGDVPYVVGGDDIITKNKVYYILSKRLKNIEGMIESLREEKDSIEDTLSELYSLKEIK